MFILSMTACSNNDNKLDKVRYKAKELPLIEKDAIGNEIPKWVENENWNKKLFAVTSSEIIEFDEYITTNFPSYSDSAWTQEQSDSVYLGKGIKIYNLDGNKAINDIVFYPVILNGIIVLGCEVASSDTEISIKYSPSLVNQLNALMELTSKEEPLVLGHNNNNTIAIIGDKCFILQPDNMLHKRVDLEIIPQIETYYYVNALNMFCTERTADVNDWIMSDR